jgi:hypothetical protein
MMFDYLKSVALACAGLPCLLCLISLIKMIGRFGL